ncbi:MAG: alpha/beta hydrolase [Hyphomicrobiales bacterium]|nr:alpha/beta hydrolase [Hyphomicrobiales bacterium]
MTAVSAEPTEFFGAEENRLAADVYGTGGAPVILLHGGGQTRHSWQETAIRLATSGFRAVTVDQRGHGESDWVTTGAYHFHDFAADAAFLMRAVSNRFGRRPVMVGASLGGIASLLAAAGEEEPAIESLVLVDITPRIDPVGVARILAFMSDRLEHGFETVEEAAEAVAAYMPHRKRPRSLSGLKKNLRRDPDGRYRWHWDPRFLNGRRSVDRGAAHFEEELVEAAKRLSMPVLLVRGAQSELVSESHVREFLDLAPHARYVDVSGAGHMVAGDRNDVFAEAIIGFVSEFAS